MGSEQAVGVQGVPECDGVPGPGRKACRLQRGVLGIDGAGAAESGPSHSRRTRQLCANPQHAGPFQRGTGASLAGGNATQRHAPWNEPHIKPTPRRSSNPANGANNYTYLEPMHRPLCTYALPMLLYMVAESGIPESSVLVRTARCLCTPTMRSCCIVCRDKEFRNKTCRAHWPVMQAGANGKHERPGWGPARTGSRRGAGESLSRLAGSRAAPRAAPLFHHPIPSKRLRNYPIHELRLDEDFLLHFAKLLKHALLFFVRHICCTCM